MNQTLTRAVFFSVFLLLPRLAPAQSEPVFSPAGPDAAVVEFVRSRAAARVQRGGTPA